MCIQFVYNFTTYCLPNNNKKNTIIPNINNKFLITSYQQKWYISNKILYINYIIPINNPKLKSALIK